MGRNKRRSAMPLFLILSAALLLILIFVGLDALSKSDLYKYESSITPTPSATPRNVRVTRDPNVVTDTPAPTALLLQNGSKGDTVLRVQQQLQALGYYQGELDGQFGKGTKQAVVWFQTQHGLANDGIVGDMTYQKMFSDAAQTARPTATPGGMVNTLSGDLPMLVNRSHTLPADFLPADLVYLRDECPESLVTIKGKDIQGVKTAVDALKKMLAQAHADGLTVWQISAGYRSYAYQKSIFDEKVAYFEQNGSSHASAISSARVTVADPGASEHHTGLAFDVTVPGESFANTKQCTWLHKHCWEYGFIVRYADEKEKITGYTGEAWHIRYVGLPHSLLMRDSGQCLEEYIESQGR